MRGPETNCWPLSEPASEPVRQYLEYMQGLARKLRLGTGSMTVQGIIQGLLPEVQRDVIFQHPSTMEALTEAVAVGERNAKIMAKPDNQTPKDDTYYEAKINQLEATIDAMQQMTASDRKAVATVNAVGKQLYPGAPTSQRQQSYNSGDVASAPTHFRARGCRRGYRGTGGTRIERPPMGPYNRPPGPRLPPQQAHSMANQEGHSTVIPTGRGCAHVPAAAEQPSHLVRQLWPESPSRTLPGGRFCMLELFRGGTRPELLPLPQRHTSSLSTLGHRAR